MAALVCRSCGRSYTIELYPHGCPRCAQEGKPGILEVLYEYGASIKHDLGRAFQSRRRHSMWRYDALLPIAAEDPRMVTLGEGGTPLVEAGWLGTFVPVKSIFLKNETANPTWCSKDRGNAVSASMGRMLNAPGMVAVTTGNHGASVAAYCGQASLPAIALMSVESDMIHHGMVAVYGGTAIVSTDRGTLLQHLVHDCGWFPVTSMGDPDAPNPFGVEAYKTIAFEVFEDLGGVPDAVLVPVASGDLLYGVFKGFHELQELGFTEVCPRIIGCQARGAAALASAFHDHLDDVPVLTNPATVATSIGDATSGRPALDAVRASSGDVLAVSDEEILTAQQYLAAHGMLVELASATTVAAAAAGVRTGALRRADRIVCVVTGSGAKWSTQMLSQISTNVLLEPSLATVTTLARKAARTAL